MRCLTLAEALAKKGWRCGFAVRNGTLDTIPALARSLHEVWVIDCAEPAEPEQLAARWPDGVDWLIVDHYGRDAAFESACRPWARQVMVIDDLADRAHDCDQLLDQTPDRRVEDYQGQVPSRCDLMVGTRFALLRHEFKAWQHWQREITPEAHKLLVTMGISDPGNVAAFLLESLANHLRRDLEVTVVVGPGNRHGETLAQAAAQATFPISLNHDPPDMPKLMAEADLAVSAGGSTCWELAFMGLPFAVMTLAANQTALAQGLSKAGVAVNLGCYRETSAKKIAMEVADLCRDHDKRYAMSRCGRSLVDGEGVNRVLAVLEEHS